MTVSLSALIDDYLESKTSAQETAQSLTNIVDSTASASDDENARFTIFEAVIARMRTFSPDSASLDNIVSLLNCLKITPSPKRAWSELVPLGMLIRELWNTSGPGREDWTTINAFAARLTAAGVLDLDNFGIWAMRTALETDDKSNQDVGSQVSAAAAWIEYAGKRMYDLSLHDAKGSQATRGGPKWEGAAGYSVARWNYWKDKFRELKESDSGNLSGIGVRAARKMEDIESV